MGTINWLVQFGIYEIPDIVDCRKEANQNQNNLNPNYSDWFAFPGWITVPGFKFQNASIKHVSFQLT